MSFAALEFLSFYGIIRVYFVPSNVAPAIKPACPKTSAITGASEVVVASQCAPRSGSA